MTGRPEIINIMGRDYTIEYVDPSPYLEAKYNGRVIPNERKIFVEKNGGEERNTLIHEIVHCIDQITDADLTEKQVCQIANGLEVFILNNQDFMDYLMAREEED